MDVHCKTKRWPHGTASQRTSRPASVRFSIARCAIALRRSAGTSAAWKAKQLRPNGCALPERATYAGSRRDGVATPLVTRDSGSIPTRGGWSSGQEQTGDGVLTSRELELTNAYWRACNYLSVGMIYLK